MLLLGIDIGTSSIKVSVVDVASRKCLAAAHYPDQESGILAIKTGWAEQSPEMWWDHVKNAIKRVHALKNYASSDIAAIGIAYQMHGLVLVDKNQAVLRNAIIWCDSRAVELGEKAFDAIGHNKSLSHLLNSPGNFTASKLAWVKENEPEIYQRIDKVMLPGDYISMKLTGEINCSVSSLSEGIFWDFKKEQLSDDVFNYYGFDPSLIPEIQPVFSSHGKLSAAIAAELSLKPGIPVTYKAGDQPNNALSLNVLEPGEVAATAGTSGVIYGVSDALTYDSKSRVNSFAHVNYANNRKRLGILLCINGTGILNRWVRNIFGEETSYAAMNQEGAAIAIGAEGLRMLPFGNGAERMLENKIIGAHIHRIDLNKHSRAHLFRAAQEGIAFAFRYGLDIMRENEMHPKVIRAGRANMFLSDLFMEAFVNATQVPVELYDCDGSVGAALGAGIGAGIYTSEKEAFSTSKPLKLVEPKLTEPYNEAYEDWKALLIKQLA